MKKSIIKFHGDNTQGFFSPDTFSHKQANGSKVTAVWKPNHRHHNSSQCERLRLFVLPPTLHRCWDLLVSHGIQLPTSLAARCAETTRVRAHVCLCVSLPGFMKCALFIISSGEKRHQCTAPTLTTIDERVFQLITECK